jgi:Domain of unknown function (DUF5667)
MEEVRSMKLTPQRRADEFAQLLVTGRRTDDPVTAPLLTVVDALAEVPATPGPRPEFRTALRQRLVAVAAVQVASPVVESPFQRARAAGGTWRVQRRLVAVGAGAAVVTAVAGVGVGASRSIPGEPFYGVKRASEGVQLATTFGTEDRGKRHLQFARARLAEVATLSGHSLALGQISGGHSYAAAAQLDASTSRLILSTLRDMDVDTRAGANDLFVAYRDSGSTEPLSALNSFTVRQFNDLHSLVGALPADVRPRAMSSLALLNLVATDTVTLAHSARTTPVTPAPSTAPVTPSRPTSRPGHTATPSPTSSRPGSHGTPTPVRPTLPTQVPIAPSVPSIPNGPLPSGVVPTSVPTLPSVTGLLGH